MKKKNWQILKIKAAHHCAALKYIFQFFIF